MSQLRILTAGESHGKELIGIIEGIPAGLPLIASLDIDPILKRRQGGYGRSHRQQIESDSAEIVSGVRFGITTGAPIAIEIENRDWKHWTTKMSVVPEEVEYQKVTIPRPGHADLVGAIKYNHTDDLRNVLERASARETAMRVALGAICTKFLAYIGIDGLSFTVSIGKIAASSQRPSEIEVLKSALAASSVTMFDAEATKRAEQAIDEAKSSGNTLGGVVQTEWYGLPVGIGSHVQWDRKLDAAIAQAVMSIQAVKAVEIGDGVALGATPGSEAHDELHIAGDTVSRSSNHAGGLEGGMTNGMPVIVRATMKPISTLMRPLDSVDLATGEETQAHIERSDVCAVPALAVIVEQVVATTLATGILDTFGGDTMNEVQDRVNQRRIAATIK